jgi:hypothetical protein
MALDSLILENCLAFFISYGMVPRPGRSLLLISRIRSPGGGSDGTEGTPLYTCLGTSTK